MGMKVSGTPRRMGRKGVWRVGEGGQKKRDEAEQDGLSGDRLTEVMRGEDEREENDSGIQMESRLTLLSFQRLLIQYPADARKRVHAHSHTCIPLSSSLLLPSFFQLQSNFRLSLLPLSASAWTRVHRGRPSLPFMRRDMKVCAPRKCKSARIQVHDVKLYS